MQSQSSVSEIDEQLSAYFDDELEDSARALVEAKLEASEELAGRLGDLSFMRTMIVGDLDHQADRVPEARFEQIWDSFDQTLERESRLQEAAEAPPPLWQRLSAWVRPIRVPLAVVGAAGALVFVFARSAGAPSAVDGEPSADAKVVSNTQADASSDAQPNQQDAVSSEHAAPAPNPGPIALAPESPSSPSSDIEPEMFPQPEPGEAEIRRIEFGGRTGTISQVEGARGTTTVIWVTEDDVPLDSERSL